MLVLTRKIEEKIVIGSDENRIIVTILDIKDGKVSVGVEADPSIPVLRSELIEEKMALSKE